MLNSLPWIALVLPSVILGAGSLARSVPGEWSQAALLSWAALLLTYLGVAAGPGPPGAWPSILCLAGAFLALSLGGWAGLGLIAVAHLLLALTTHTGATATPWWPAALTGTAAAVAAIRGWLH